MSVQDPVTQYIVEHPEQSASIAAAFLATLFHYVKTGKLPIGRLPWKAAREILGELRREYFGKARKRGVPGQLVEAKPETVNNKLRDKHFEGVDFSYEYTKQAWDLRRPAGVATHPDTGEDIPMELHVRAFETDLGNTMLLSHYEASRYEAPGEHLTPGLYSWSDGQAMMAGVLPDSERIESEKDAGLTIV